MILHLWKNVSSGWFDRFKKCLGIHNAHLQGEIASADDKALSSFHEELQKIIADKTGLFWNKMPSKTYLIRNENSQTGYKVSKNHVILLLCSNASRDYKIKPLYL